MLLASESLTNAVSIMIFIASSSFVEPSPRILLSFLVTNHRVDSSFTYSSHKRRYRDSESDLCVRLGQRL